MESDYYERNLSPRPRSQLSSEYSGASTVHPVEWQDDWIHREEEFRDTINALQTEQERIQKKTFTNWINSHLVHVSCQSLNRNQNFISDLQHPQKYVVKDLFADLKDGRCLLALLEVITNDRLPCETFRHYTRAHYLSNVERALDYLRDRHIKLVNINSSDIVDGNETVILGLIWTIILNFQIDQDLAHLRENFLISPLPSGAQSASYDTRSRSVSPSPNKKAKLPARGRFQAGASKAMLKWCQKEISDNYRIPIVNLSTSWKDGLAFLGLVKVLDPNLVNLNDYRDASAGQRMTAAFGLAEEHFGIPKFLDVADIDVDRPDERSIMTYIAQFIKRFPEAKRNRQKLLMEDLPDIQAVEAGEKAEYERIRDWCLDILTVLKVLELTEERPYEVYEEYKKFQQAFRTHISAYARLKERFEERRTIQITEENIIELDSLFARVISEKQIWHRHLFAPLQGYERQCCIRFEKIETELDQRVLLPPQRVTHYSKTNLEFRVQKHEDTLNNLIHLRGELNSYLRKEYPTEVFALHDLPNSLEFLISDLERRLLIQKCQLGIKRQLSLVEEWENRITRWKELLQLQTNLDRLLYEFDAHVVQDQVFDKFLALSRQLQNSLERLQEAHDADKSQRAEFLSSAVSLNRRWKRITEEIHEIREQIVAYRMGHKRTVAPLDSERLPVVPQNSLSSNSAYLSTATWISYQERALAFTHWLDRMERDFESIDREDVNQTEYQRSLQRFRALCNEVVEHKTDGQDLIDTFYACSFDLPHDVASSERRKINRLIRRYDALIPSLEIIRSETERTTVHAHQLLDTNRETVQLVPEQGEHLREQVVVREALPVGGAVSPAASVATSGYATPDFENSLLRRSEPTTPSESFNRSPPFAHGISSHEGSPLEQVYVRDMEVEEGQADSTSPTYRRLTTETLTYVRNVPVRDESSPGPSTSAPQKPRVKFAKSKSPSSSSPSSSDEKSGKRAHEKELVSTKKMRAVGETTSAERITAHRRNLDQRLSEPEGSKVKNLRAAFESSPTDSVSVSKVKPMKKPGGVYEHLRRKTEKSSSSSSSSSSDEDEGKPSSSGKSAKRIKPELSKEQENIKVRVRTDRDSQPRPTSDAEVESGPYPTSKSPSSERPKYLRKTNTTTLVTTTETKTVKTFVTKSPRSEEPEVPFVGGARVAKKFSHGSTPEEASESVVRIATFDTQRETEKIPVLSKVAALRRRHESTEEEAPPPKPDESKKPLDILKTKKKQTKTEFEEVSQTVKRVVVAPLRIAEKASITTVPTATAVREAEKVTVERQRPSVDTESVPVVIAPYGVSKASTDVTQGAQPLSPLINLWERGSSDPSLFERKPEELETVTVVRRSESPDSHVSSTMSVHLSGETVPKINLAGSHSVSQSVRKFEEIFAPLDTEPEPFETTFVTKIQTPTSETVSERIQETASTSTDEEKPKKKGSIFSKLKRSSKISPSKVEEIVFKKVESQPLKVTTTTTTKDVIRTPETETETMVREVKRSEEPRSAEHFQEVIRKFEQDEGPERFAILKPNVTTTLTIPVQRPETETVVRDVKHSEEPRSGEHFQKIVRKFEQEEGPEKFVIDKPHVITKITFDEKTETKELENPLRTLVPTSSTSEKISHFTNLSDKTFETKVFKKDSGSVREEIMETPPEATAVKGKVKLFENVGGIEYAKPAEETLVELSSRRSSDSVQSIPLSSQRSTKISSAEMTPEPKEPLKRKVISILENFGQPTSKKELRSVSSRKTPNEMETIVTSTKTIRERPSEPVIHETGLSDRDIVSDSAIVRPVEERIEIIQEAVQPPENWKCVYPLDQTISESIEPSVLASQFENREVFEESVETRRIGRFGEVTSTTQVRSPERQTVESLRERVESPIRHLTGPRDELLDSETVMRNIEEPDESVRKKLDFTEQSPVELEDVQIQELRSRGPEVVHIAGGSDFDITGSREVQTPTPEVMETFVRSSEREASTDGEGIRLDKDTMGMVVEEHVRPTSPLVGAISKLEEVQVERSPSSKGNTEETFITSVPRERVRSPTREFLEETVIITESHIKRPKVTSSESSDSVDLRQKTPSPTFDTAEIEFASRSRSDKHIDHHIGVPDSIVKPDFREAEQIPEVPPAEQFSPSVSSYRVPGESVNMRPLLDSQSRGVVEHHFGISDAAIAEHVTHEDQVITEVVSPQVIPEKVELLRDVILTPEKKRESRLRTVESLSENVVVKKERSDRSSSLDQLRESEIVVRTSSPSRVEDVVRGDSHLRSKSPSQKTSEETVVVSRIPSSHLREEHRALSPKREFLNESVMISKAQKLAVRERSPSPSEEFRKRPVYTIQHDVSDTGDISVTDSIAQLEVVIAEEEEFDRIETRARISSSSSSVSISSTESGAHKLPSRKLSESDEERRRGSLEEMVPVREFETLIIDGQRPVQSEEFLEVHVTKLRSADIRHSTGVKDAYIEAIIPSPHENLPEQGSRKTKEFLDEKVTSIETVPDRSLVPQIVHRTGLKDHYVETVLLAAPREIDANVSETDLAPKRHTSSVHLQKSGANPNHTEFESEFERVSFVEQPTQPYPWTAIAVTAEPAPVEVSSVSMEESLPLTETVVRETVVTETVERPPKLVTEVTSSSTSLESSESPKQDKKKPNIFNLFKSNKKPKEPKASIPVVVSSSETVVKKKVTPTGTPTVTRNVVMGEKIEGAPTYQQKGISEVSFRKTSEEVVENEPIEQELQREVVLRDSTPVFHAGGVSDRDVESMFVPRTQELEIHPDEEVLSESVVSSDVRDSALLSTTVASYPAEEELHPSTRATTVLPSFIAFERTTSPKPSSSKKTRTKTESQSSTGSRKTSTSSSKSSLSEEEKKRTGVVRKSDTIVRSTSPPPVTVTKIRQEKVERRSRPPSAEPPGETKEEYSEKVVVERRPGSRTEKSEKVTTFKTRSRSRTQSPDYSDASTTVVGDRTMAGQLSESSVDESLRVRQPDVHHSVGLADSDIGDLRATVPVQEAVHLTESHEFRKFVDENRRIEDASYSPAHKQFSLKPIISLEYETVEPSPETKKEFYEMSVVRHPGSTKEKTTSIISRLRSPEIGHHVDLTDSDVETFRDTNPGLSISEGPMAGVVYEPQEIVVVPVHEAVSLAKDHKQFREFVEENRQTEATTGTESYKQFSVEPVTNVQELVQEEKHSKVPTKTVEKYSEVVVERHSEATSEKNSSIVESLRARVLGVGHHVDVSDSEVEELSRASRALSMSEGPIADLLFEADESETAPVRKSIPLTEGHFRFREFVNENRRRGDTSYLPAHNYFTTRSVKVIPAEAELVELPLESLTETVVTVSDGRRKPLIAELPRIRPLAAGHPVGLSDSDVEAFREKARALSASEEPDVDVVIESQKIAPIPEYISHDEGSNFREFVQDMRRTEINSKSPAHEQFTEKSGSWQYGSSHPENIQESATTVGDLSSEKSTRDLRVKIAEESVVSNSAKKSETEASKKKKPVLFGFFKSLGKSSESFSERTIEETSARTVEPLSVPEDTHLEVSRERPSGISHLFGTSDTSVTEFANSTQLGIQEEPIASETHVRPVVEEINKEMVVVSKPVAKPRTWRDSSPRPTESLERVFTTTETEEISKEPRERVEHRREHFADRDVAPVARLVDVLPTDSVVRNIESEKVTQVRGTEFNEIPPLVPQRPTTTETLVSESVTPNSTKAEKSERKKSKGLFGIFKRKGSKGEVEDESSFVQKTSVEKSVTKRKDSASSEASMEVSAAKPAVVVVSREPVVEMLKVEPIPRPPPVEHRAGITDHDLEGFFIKSQPEIIDLESESMNKEVHHLVHHPGRKSVSFGESELLTLEHVHHQESVKEAALKSKGIMKHRTESPTQGFAREVEHLEEFIEPRKRPLAVEHEVGVRDSDFESRIIQTESELEKEKPKSAVEKHLLESSTVTTVFSPHDEVPKISKAPLLVEKVTSETVTGVRSDESVFRPPSPEPELVPRLRPAEVDHHVGIQDSDFEGRMMEIDLHSKSALRRSTEKHLVESVKITTEPGVKVPPKPPARRDSSETVTVVKLHGPETHVHIPPATARRLSIGYSDFEGEMAGVEYHTEPETVAVVQEPELPKSHGHRRVSIGYANYEGEVSNVEYHNEAEMIHRHSEQLESVPHHRPFEVAHGEHVGDRDFESDMTRLNIADKALKTLENFEEHVTTTHVQESKPHVEFGVSRRPKISKELFQVVPPESKVIGARLVTPEPEEYVTTREIVMPSVVPSDHTQIASLRTHGLVTVNVAPQHEEVFPGIKHPSGPKDMAFSQHFVVGSEAKNTESFKENVTVTTVTKAKKATDGSSSSSSGSASESEGTMDSFRIRRARPAAVQAEDDSSLSSDEELGRSHSERVRRIHIQEPRRRPTPLVEFSESVVRHEEPSTRNAELFETPRRTDILGIMVPRLRPEEVEHFIGMSDRDVENDGKLASEIWTDKVTPQAPVGHLVSGKPKMEIYQIDPDETEHVQESVRTVTAEDVSKIKVKSKAPVPPKLKVAGSVTESALYRAPEVREEYEERTSSLAREIKPISQKSLKPELEENTTVRSEVIEEPVESIVIREKTRKDRREEDEKRKMREETTVGEIEMVTPPLSTTSEIATRSTSRTGSRSKTPDFLKSKSFKTVTKKVSDEGGSGSKKNKEYVHYHEDVIYTKPAKVKSPDVSERSATISLGSRPRTPEATITTVTRSSTLPFGDSQPSSSKTETFVREVADDHVKTVTRQKVIETTRTSGGLTQKPVIKKQSRSSSSSSSRDDGEEIIAVTKSKLTSPTPEPRDEVQLVLAEMKAKEVKPSKTAVTGDESIVVTGGSQTFHEVTERQIESVIKSQKAPHITHEVVPLKAEIKLTEVTREKIPKKGKTKRIGTGSPSSSSSESEDEHGKKVKKAKKNKEKMVSEEMREEISELRAPEVRPVKYKNSETGSYITSVLQHGPTKEIPSYVNFGSVEPELLMEGRTTDLFVERSEERIRRRIGPKDLQVESFWFMSSDAEKLAPKDKATDGTEKLTENVSRTETSQAVQEAVAIRQRKSGAVALHSPSQLAITERATVVRSSETGSEEGALKARSISKVITSEKSTTLPVESIATTSYVREAQSLPKQETPEMISKTMVRSRPSTSQSQRSDSKEQLEEHVEVVRVKLSEQSSNLRVKSPNIFKGHENFSETVEVEREGVVRSRSRMESPSPLGLPYPKAYTAGRDVMSAPEINVMRVYTASSKEPQHVQETVAVEERALVDDDRLEVTSVGRRILHTPDSLEEDLVAITIPYQSSVTPEVGNMEYWTTSGGSSSGLDDDRTITRTEITVNSLNRDSQFSESSGIYETIPPRSTLEIRRIEIVTSPSTQATLQVAPSIIETTVRKDVPVYAKVQKRKNRESLVEDVFYWKVINRRKNKAYSAERIRARSPENNLTPEELNTLARSVSSLSGDLNIKKFKSQTVSKSRTSRRAKSVSDTERSVVISPGFEDSGTFSASGDYQVDLRLTSSLNRSSKDEAARSRTTSKLSPFTKAKQLTVSEDSTTSMKSRSFSPSSVEGSTSVESVQNTSTPPMEKTSRIRKEMVADIKSERIMVLTREDSDRAYRAAMREPLPEQHSCLPVYNSLYENVLSKLQELEESIVDPESQYIDEDLLIAEHQRLTAVLDALIRVNKNLERLGDLYRAMTNVESEESIWEVESKQRELNRLYMDLLFQLKCILRRIRHLQSLLEEYKKRRMHFKVRLLEELTYFRTHDNMPEDDQRERVNCLLEDVLKLRSATYSMFVRSTSEFAVRLEDELHEILTLLRTELRVATDNSDKYGSIIQLLLTGRYSVEFDADQQQLILSSDEISSEIPTTFSRTGNPTVWTILRRALPMQALALILLGFASLIPMTDDEFSCLFSNYFASSFNPALTFSGPPPI